MSELWAEYVVENPQSFTTSNLKSDEPAAGQPVKRSSDSR